jgi:hypothetical protein
VVGDRWWRWGVWGDCVVDIRFEELLFTQEDQDEFKQSVVSHSLNNQRKVTDRVIGGV